jgi:hypothetical protein
MYIVMQSCPYFAGCPGFTVFPALQKVPLIFLINRTSAQWIRIGKKGSKNCDGVFYSLKGLSEVGANVVCDLLPAS